MKHIEKKIVGSVLLLVGVLSLLMTPMASAITYYYLQTKISESAIGSGSVTNPSYITGSPDGNYAYISGPAGSGGMIVADMGTTITGGQFLCLYAYSSPSSLSYTYIYTANSSAGPWHCIDQKYFTASLDWRYSSCSDTYRYVAIAAYDQGTVPQPVDLHIDSVRAQVN